MDGYIAYFDETGDDGIATASSKQFIHSDIRMTAEIYTHIVENDVANSADKISDYFSKSRQS
jgi:hypothetical protein